MKPSCILLGALLGLAAACAGRPGPRDRVSTGEVPPPVQLDGTAFEAAARVELPEVAPGEYPGLHNVYWLSESILSGGEPADPAALEQLADWGVKTLLSVDGKAPDAETAAALGMRYVHVPIQYKGIGDEEMRKIAKTFRELQGPFYVHCFHGRHRGPAAAAVGRIVLDAVPREEAIAEMRQWCATSSKYEGLYAAVATADLPTRAETERFAFDFAPAHAFEGLRAGMIEMTRKWDLVKAAEIRDWASDPAHPDVDPLREALELHQIYEALVQLEATHAWQDDFRAWLEQGRRGSERLLEALSAGSQPKAGESDWRAEAAEAYDLVAGSCASCHGSYRN